MAGVLRGVRSVGFSGSRSPSAASVAALARLLPLVPRSGCRLSVGCAAGVDAVVRESFAGSQSLLVFQVARFVSGVGFGRAAFAVRSARCVRSVARGRRGLLVVVPSGACPSGVRPGRSFRGCGSGSWGSAALAAGLGRRVLVWLAAGVVPPVWSGFEWVGVGGGWWLLSRSSVVQLSLF
ncbi:hypothetical protein BCD64_00045 [Nostoc sp. MBR 210]|nr:hypothetical protein BCD64_00045 [Nostoc sp. MBR 210]